jgi:hypothetical protein
VPDVQYELLPPIVGTAGNAFTVLDSEVAIADWQVTPPAHTVNRTVADFAPAAAELNG